MNENDVVYFLELSGASTTKASLRLKITDGRYGRGNLPMTKDSTPITELMSIMCFIAGISTSPPSRPNLFSDDHFLARNDSNL